MNGRKENYAVMNMFLTAVMYLFIHLFIYFFIFLNVLLNCFHNKTLIHFYVFNCLKKYM